MGEALGIIHSEYNYFCSYGIKLIGYLFSKISGRAGIGKVIELLVQKGRKWRKGSQAIVKYSYKNRSRF